ncbi:unnamed protein product [Ectocarpus sp. CCAP 1310/34]|nr:unnamed protein product [Ectocarpus sp. CCAP 1310/34]
MDDMDDVAAFWQHHAEGFCPQGNPLHVWQELLLAAARRPERFREALQAAAVAVGARYCNHDSPPGPLPDISELPERQAAARQHAGLCGKYHSEHIANIDVTMVEERAAGTEITTKRMRNQCLLRRRDGVQRPRPWGSAEEAGVLHPGLPRGLA